LDLRRLPAWPRAGRRSGCRCRVGERPSLPQTSRSSRAGESGAERAKRVEAERSAQGHPGYKTQTNIVRPAGTCVPPGPASRWDLRHAGTCVTPGPASRRDLRRAGTLEITDRARSGRPPRDPRRCRERRRRAPFP
jgi:hypothetical protein